MTAWTWIVTMPIAGPLTKPSKLILSSTLKAGESAIVS
jgi:hypothetical protein